MKSKRSIIAAAALVMGGVAITGCESSYSEAEDEDIIVQPAGTYRGPEDRGSYRSDTEIRSDTGISSSGSGMGTGVQPDMSASPAGGVIAPPAAGASGSGSVSGTSVEGSMQSESGTGAAAGGVVAPPAQPESSVDVNVYDRSEQPGVTGQTPSETDIQSSTDIDVNTAEPAGAGLSRTPPSTTQPSTQPAGSSSTGRQQNGGALPAGGSLGSGNGSSAADEPAVSEPEQGDENLQPQ